MKGMIAD